MTLLTDLSPTAPQERHDLSMRSDKPILDVRHIGVDFKVDGGKIHAVRDVSFQLYAQETIAIVGESGSGKSVTARAIMGLLSRRAALDSKASITYEDKNILQFSPRQKRKLRGDRISMIFQEPMSSLNPVYTIGAQIVEAIRIHRRISKRKASHQALSLLRQVQIPQAEARLHQYPHQLSGGQRQRVMIAMALANKPDILIADEPTTALDVTVQAQILQLIRNLQQEMGMAVILITHDLTVVQQFSDYVYVMQKGLVVEHNTTKTLFQNPRHPYSRSLLEAEPSGRANPMPENSPALLEAKQVNVNFMLRGGGFFRPHYSELRAVNNLSITLHRHETLGLVGESGSGKTTFGQALIRLIKAQAHNISFDGEAIHQLSRAQMRPFRARMQIVFQDPFASLNPRMTIGQIIEEGLIVNKIGANKAERLERVCDALSSSGMPSHILSRFPHEFSGGQRQRIAIARAIALEPEFILLDEPTSALDLSVQAQIIDLLRGLQQEKGLSYLFISHDLKVVRNGVPGKCDVIKTDARAPDCTGEFNLVITSPPYPNNYDYADATRLEMVFWGEVSSWGGLHDAVRRYLLRSCSQHSAKERLELAPLLQEKSVAPIKHGLEKVCLELEDIRQYKGGKKTYHTMIAAYFSDISKVFLSLRKLTTEDARMAFVIGDSAPYGVHVPVERWLGELAIAAGFRQFHFEKIRDRNNKWKNRKHTVPLQEGILWIEG